MALTHRTQVLLDDRRDQLLRRRAAATGRSVGDLIREAIDRTYAGAGNDEAAEKERREASLASFLAADPMPVDNLEEDLDSLYERDL
ncbi:MAG: ribbon-helix-helix protein, CopG family [Solirubrobacterales bacterium]